MRRQGIFGLAVALALAVPAPALASTLTVDPAGGTWMGATGTRTLTGDAGTVAYVPVPRWEGHSFAGWVLTGPGTKGDGSYVYGSADATLTAVWDTSDYTVRYDANGGAFADGSTGSETTVSCGERWSVREAPTRDGYDFVDWVSGALDRTYAPGEEVVNALTLDGSVITLRAEWKATADTVAASSSHIHTNRGAKGADASTATADVRAFVEKALSAIGSGYSGSGYYWTGSPSGSWFTCSGLVDWALGNSPHTNWPEKLMATTGSSKSMDQLAYGDLTYYVYGSRRPGHVAIYIGNGQIVDAEPNGGVQIRAVDFPGTYLGGGSIL